MNGNPYAPPSARVADVVPEAILGTNRSVELACKLIWLTLLLAVLNTVAELTAKWSATLAIGRVFGLLVFFAIYFWCISKLRAGRNWMRLLYSIWVGAGYLLMALFWSTYRPIVLNGTERTVMFCAQLIAGIGAIVLINTRSARNWFALAKRIAPQATSGDS